jgi:sphingomyelin phosphodiesterase acid-like 3
MRPKPPYLDFDGTGVDLLGASSPITSTRQCRVVLVICAALLLAGIAFLSLIAFVTYSNFETTFLYLNDIHFDPRYNDRSNATTWCHETVERLPTTFRFSRYGCDTPMPLLESLLTHVHRLIRPPTAIVLGGDYSAGIYNPLPSYFHPIIELVFHKISAAFPKTPILPVLGNSEFSPNYGRWSNDTLNYQGLAHLWSQFLDSSEMATFTKGGYFFRDLPQVRIVLLNTVMYHVVRGEGPSDPYEQLEWLDRVCAEARALGLVVLVFGHIAPAVSTRERLQQQGWRPEYADRFAELAAKHEFTATAGHFHMDALLPLFNSNGRHQGYMMSPPSVSPRHDSNPAFRVIKVHGGLPIDYDQYCGDIVGNPRDDVIWRHEYSFRKLYGVDNLTNVALKAVADKVMSDPDAMWNYREMMHAGNYNTRSFHRCVLVAVSREELTRCLEESTEMTRM